jgi:BirA family biotin operon repressor/biotin-[acetyl-CoA-carboxylase] ligase
MTDQGWRLRCFASLPSTSDHCVALAAAGEPDGLAVLALRQTAGRGSRGRGWESPSGNLYLSVLLRPEGLATEVGRWALLASVAVAEALVPLVPEPVALRLKWPNDVMLDQRKLAGILLDSAATPEGRLDWLVIGIGVNLRVAPAIPDRTAAFLAEVVDPPAPEDFATVVLDRLAARRMSLPSDFARVRAAWLAHGQPIGRPMQFRHCDRLEQGTFEGLAEDGSLLMRTGGRVHAFATGEVLLPKTDN